jgi:phosphatidylinositol kinase/protein kinase (PI-3  family)
MGILRDNKESLMAVLEAFVYDPLISWRLFTPGREKGALLGKKNFEKKKFPKKK